MDPKMLEILACPVCKGPVRFLSQSKELVCVAERIAFPIKDGIPVMLVSESRTVSEQEWTAVCTKSGEGN